MNPAVLFIAGGAALLLAGGKKKRAAPKLKVVCPPLSPGGGNLAGFEYIEFTTGGASLDEKLPLVIFFHSLGADPEGLAKHISGIPASARIVMPYGRTTYGSGPAWWRLRSKTEDQEELARQMDNESIAMLDFVEQATHCFPTVGKPVIVGHSQGGMMTYAVAAQGPELVKAAVPTSGWLPIDLWPSQLPPTYAVHGTKDRTVNYERTADFITRAQGAGLPIEFHPVTGHGHGLSGELKTTWLQIVDWAIRTDI